MIVPDVDNRYLDAIAYVSRVRDLRGCPGHSLEYVYLRLFPEADLAILNEMIRLCNAVVPLFEHPRRCCGGATPRIDEALRRDD